MTLQRNGYEAATGTYATNLGTIPAAAGETALTAVISGGSMTTLTTGAYAGNRAMQFNPAAGQFLAHRAALPAASSRLALDFVMRFPSVTTDETYLVQARNGATNSFSLTYLPTGFVRIRMSGSSNLWTSSVAVPLNTFVKVALCAVMDPTTPTNSRIKAGLFTPGTLTPIAAGSSTEFVTAALGQTSVDTFQTGKVSSNTDATSFVMDELRWDEEATDYIPVTSGALQLQGVVTPIDHIVGTQQTLTLTATGGNANPKTYSAVWDGVSMGPQLSNVFTKTDTTAGVKNWTASVSQS